MGKDQQSDSAAKEEPTGPKENQPPQTETDEDSKSCEGHILGSPWLLMS